MNRALEDSNRLRGELQAAEREKKEAKVLFILHGCKKYVKKRAFTIFWTLKAWNTPVQWLCEPNQFRLLIFKIFINIKKISLCPFTDQT